jgi:two-component system chemotaxis sensor kinase CheA
MPEVAVALAAAPPPVAGPPVPPSEPESRELYVEDAELLHLFIQEAQDHLQTMEGKIIALETVKDPDNINAVFRCMHTIKGNSSFLGLTELNRLSHRLESVLDGLRSDTLSLSTEIIDVLLGGTDILLGMIGRLEASRQAAVEKNPAAASIRISVHHVDDGGLLGRVERILPAGGARSAAPSPAPREPASPKPRAEVGVSGGTERPRPATASGMELVTDEIVQRFTAESADLLDTAERSLLDLEGQPNQSARVDEAFRAIHTIKGNAGFMGLTEVEATCMKTEADLDTLRTGEKSATAGFISTLLSEVDAIRRALAGPGTPDPEDTEANQPVGEILVGMGETTREDVEHALSFQDRRVGEILVAEGKVSPVALQRALDVQKRPEGAPEAAAERKDIRVDTVKLDKLFDLMGELITAEAMVIHNPDLEDLELERFSKSASYLSKITREMQEITLTVRMIPLEGLFSKMRRLVRDLARKSGKSIELKVSGQETEMDRNVIEEISDPLVHLIRNAIDHGIEPVEVRTLRDKPPAGTITLDARYEGNEIWVSVRDDGGGLDRERILAKAAERGLLTADPETLREEEVWSFIFEPGFSTATKVSEVSGRGVGMDVVKRNMDKLRGKADVSSTLRQGTQITLKIPLTLAIIDAVSVKVGSVRYEVPLADVVLFHKAAAKEITRTTEGREVIRLRGSLIPVIKLFEFFHAATQRTATPDGILVVVKRGGTRVALLADEIAGYQQIVVKALPQYLNGLRAISGCSILGNGEVSLIIDTAALIKEELQ